MLFKLNPIYLMSILLAAPSIAMAGNIVNDSFESGDMSAPGGGNFSWDSNNRTSVVTMDSEDGAVAVWNNKEIYNIASGNTDWTAFDGAHSLRFRYGAGEHWSEQRFDIGGAHPEIWMSFWLRVPTNFFHENSSRTNQKLLSLWMDGYSADGDGSTVNMEFRPDGNGGSNFYVKTTKGRNNVTGRDQGSVSFISTPEDRGKWMNLVIRVVSESKEDAADGSVEVWRKWAGEDYVKTHNRTNQPIRLPDSGPQGFSKGYLMGYANGPYKQNTEFLIDEFRLSTESLLTSGSSAPSRPSAPENVTTR